VIVNGHLWAITHLPQGWISQWYHKPVFASNLLLRSFLTGKYVFSDFLGEVLAEHTLYMVLFNEK
jgi:hypothetical protein